MQMPNYTAQALAYSVVLLSRPASAIESTETSLGLPRDELQETLKTIFGDPIHTEIGITSAGGVGAQLHIPGSSVVKTAAFDALRLEIRTTSAGEAGVGIVRLYRLLRKYADVLEPFAYGLNFEMEITHDAMVDASTWLADRFLRDGLTVEQEWSVMAQRLRFVLRKADAGQKTIDLQPLPGRGSYIYAYVNNHFDSLHDVTLDDAESWSKALNDEFDRSRQLLVSLFAERVISSSPPPLPSSP